MRSPIHRSKLSFRWYFNRGMILILLLLGMPHRGLCAGEGSGLDDYMGDAHLWKYLVEHDQEWYRTVDARSIAETLLGFQQNEGGWPKNIEYEQIHSKKDIKGVKKKHKNLRPTIDNGATYTELYFLANIYRETKDLRFLKAFNRGLDYLLVAQYKNGGWPQYFPLRKGYYTHITYNDDAMVGVMMLLHDVVSSQVPFDFVDKERREQAGTAEVKGIECILKTQQRRGDKATVWCAQHHEGTLVPVPARKYELASLSGKESAGILLYLMELEEPSKAIKEAIVDGIAWFEQVQIVNKRIIREADQRSPTGMNQILIEDQNAEAIWARFYDLNTDEPIFSDRDSKRYARMSEISYERRNEYGWYGTWPKITLKYYHEVWFPTWMNSQLDNRKRP